MSNSSSSEQTGRQIARTAEISSDQAIQHLVETYTRGRRSPLRDRCRDAYVAEQARRVADGSWAPRSAGGGQRTPQSA